MAFRLFVDSSTGVTINPEYDYTEKGGKIENVHRVRSGAEYRYKWGDYDRWKMSVMYVSSEFKSIVNSWWNSNTDLLFMEEGSSVVYSVHLINRNTPVGKLVKPYNDEFKGTIELGTY